MSYFASVGWKDTTGASLGFKNVDGKPRFSDMPYAYDIAEGNVTGHTPFVKIGYTPTMTTTVSDVWSGAGVYPFPTAASQWKLVTVANDVGAVIRGNAEGANQSTLCDVDGSTTTLIDADGVFTSGTVVEAGDLVIMTPKGDGSTAALTPEWGYVTSVAATTLTFSGGLSSGGSCDVARAYSIVNQNVASSGALAVKIEYLTTDFTQKSIIVICGGGTVNIDGSDGNALTETYRINSFRIIGMGVAGTSAGNVQIQLVSTSAVINWITAGYTRARNICYTVPKSKTLYITQLTAGFALPAKATVVDNCRFFLRANREPSTNFFTGTLFYPYTEAISDGAALFELLIVPAKFTTGTDIKMSGIASVSGSAIGAMRGWLE